MISIRNVEKFLNDHLEIDEKTRKQISKKAKANADENGIISGSAIEIIFGELKSQFLNEIMTSEEHMEMGFADIKKAGRDSENRQK